MEAGWLLLVYKIPPEPSRYRVAVWRRLKEAGAIYLQNSTCALPAGEAHAALFAGLAKEIATAGGESLILGARGQGATEDDKIVARFNAERDGEYGEVLEQCAAFLEEIRRETARQNFTFGELEENEGNLVRLTTWAEKVKQRDFFGASRRDEVDVALADCGRNLDEFAARVVGAQDG